MLGGPFEETMKTKNADEWEPKDSDKCAGCSHRRDDHALQKTRNKYPCGASEFCYCDHFVMVTERLLPLGGK